jgi:hypothetical protein
MKQTFLMKYQDYCRTRDQREELFKMSQKEEEILEDYMECLKYNLQRSKHNDLDKDILKTILIQGMRDDCMDMLKLMGKGDISKEPLEEIIDLCLRSSRGSSRNIAQTRDTTARIQKYTNGGVTREKIGIYLRFLKPMSLSL